MKTCLTVLRPATLATALTAGLAMPGYAAAMRLDTLARFNGRNCTNALIKSDQSLSALNFNVGTH